MKALGSIVRPPLKAAYRKALAEIRGGCDVVSPLLARTLRDIEKKHPELLVIAPAAGQYGVGAVRPYFHARLSAVGEVALAPAAGAKKGGAQ